VDEGTLRTNIAIVEGNIARAMIRAMAMQAENMQSSHRGDSMAYNERAFLALIDEESIGYNSIVMMLRD
jgi:hypothetical protein